MDVQPYFLKSNLKSYEELGILQNFTFGIFPYQCGPALLFNGRGQMWQEGRKCFCSSWIFCSTLGWVLLYFTSCDWVTWIRNRKSINTCWEYDCFLKGANFNLLIFWRRKVIPILCEAGTTMGTNDPPVIRCLLLLSTTYPNIQQ